MRRANQSARSDVNTKWCAGGRARRGGLQRTGAFCAAPAPGGQEEEPHEHELAREPDRPRSPDRPAEARGLRSADAIHVGHMFFWALRADRKPFRGMQMNHGRRRGCGASLSGRGVSIGIACSSTSGRAHRAHGRTRSAIFGPRWIRSRTVITVRHRPRRAGVCVASCSWTRLFRPQRLIYLRRRGYFLAFSLILLCGGGPPARFNTSSTIRCPKNPGRSDAQIFVGMPIPRRRRSGSDCLCRRRRPDSELDRVRTVACRCWV